MQRIKNGADFTQGKVFMKLVLFVLPIIATNLLQTFYNAADMMVVSLSDETNAVGAIGVTGSFINLVVNVFIGFSVGTNVVVAREIGSKNKERAQCAVHTSLLMAVGFGFIGMLIGLAVTKPVLRLMGAEGSLLRLATAYTCIYFTGVPFLSLTNYLISIFRAKGDAKTPLVVLSISGLLNIALNLFFVLVVRLSVEGVAIATAISNVASTVLLLGKLKKAQDYTTFFWRKLKIDKQAFRDIAVHGLPSGLQGALFSLSNMLIQSSIVSVNNRLWTFDDSAPVVNGSAAAGNIEGFVYTAMNAVYQGAITVTSQNVGARKSKRVYRIMGYCYLLVTIVGVIMSALAISFRVPLLSLYDVKSGAEGSLDGLTMYAAQTRFLYIIAPYFLCGMMEVSSGVLRGLGKSFTSMLISLVGSCVLRILWISFVFPQDPTLETIFISYPITWLLTTCTAFVTGLVVLKKRVLIEKREETTLLA